VDTWVVLAALSEFVYAWLFLAAAIIFALHVTGHQFTWILELVLLVFMLLSKTVVAIAAFQIHRYLSLDARRVAGTWFLVYAAGTFATACFALCFLSPLALLISSPRSWCKVIKLASLPAGGVLVLQIVCSLALFVLHRRIDSSCAGAGSAGRLGQAARWRQTLVLASGAICVLWYLGSVLVMVAMWGVDAAAPAAGGMFILGALAQICVGLSLYKINSALKAHFSGGERTELKTRDSHEAALDGSASTSDQAQADHDVQRDAGGSRAALSGEGDDREGGGRREMFAPTAVTVQLAREEQ
jgi:hypothetical protein